MGVSGAVLGAYLQVGLIERVEALAERALREIVADGEQQADGGEEMVVVIVQKQQIGLEETSEDGVARQAVLRLRVNGFVMLLEKPLGRRVAEC